MKRRETQKHCSDEQLLLHADGELRLFQKATVERHLKKCWKCRARLSEIEAAAEELARLLDESMLLDPERVTAAKCNLLRRRRQFEEEFSGRGVLRSTGPRWARVSAVASAVIVLALATGRLFLPGFQRSQRPAEILALVEQHERDLFQGDHAVHQTMRVEVAQLKSGRVSSTGRVEIWSDSPASRLAVRWTSASGVLKYAMWRTAGMTHPVYYPASGAPDTQVAVKSLSELPIYGVTPDQLEKAFIEWLRIQQWHPVSFSSEFAAFADRSGAPLVLKRIQLPSRPPVLQLRAVRSVRGRQVEIVMEVDGKTWQPRIQRIRFSDGQQSVEFRLFVEQVERVPSTVLSVAVLGPGSWPAFPQREVRQSRGENARPFPDSGLTLDRNEQAIQQTVNLDALEIAVLYRLHQHRLCQGEPIEVLRDSRSWIRVQGVASTVGRKEELFAALSDFTLKGPVSIEIVTPDETIGSTIPPSHQPGELEEVRGTRLPFEDDLSRYFADRRTANGGKSVSRQIAKLANDAVSAGQESLAEAWALRRLLERYPDDRIRGLDEQSRRLLQIMVRDHSAALQASLARTRAIVEPVLTWIARQRGIKPVPGIPRTDREKALDGFSGVFSSTQELDNILQALFAGGVAPAVSEFEKGSPVRVRVKSTDQCVAEALEVLPNLDGDLGKIDAQLSSIFQAGERSRLAPTDRR